MVRENIKLFLDNKLLDCKAKIKKMKRKRKVIKAIYVTTIVLSISASTVVSVLALSLPLLTPAIIVNIAGVGALATAISIKFNLKDKKEELNNEISRLGRLQQEMKYVVTCNGNLTDEEINRIIKEFI